MKPIERKNAFFGYEFQPLKDDYKKNVVHVEINKYGRFKDELFNKASEIKEEAEKAKINIIAFATDADPKTIKLNKEFYDFYSQIENFDQILEEMKNYKKMFPISDMFHLIKAMRRKYMDNTISVITQSQLVRNQNEKNILEKPSKYNSIAEIKFFILYERRFIVSFI